MNVNNNFLDAKVYNKINAPKRDELLQKIGDDEDGAKQPKRNTGELDKDAFLQLLTTQLANQDPLSPMEDREFIAQLAQFSSLEQMTELNKTFNKQSEEMIDAVDTLNMNQMQANAMLLKQLIVMKNGLEEHLGKDLDGDGNIGKPTDKPSEDKEKVETDNKVDAKK